MRLLLPRLTCALLLVACPAAVARETNGPPGAVPEKNFSHIHADVDWVVKAFQAAEASARAGDWATAVRTLQAQIDQRMSRDSPLDAAPYVREVHGSSVYEGAWIVARHQISAWGEEALDVYAREFGGTARGLLDKALSRRDPVLLAELARRFLGLPEGRRAALLLVDQGLERGDTDAALGWIEALEDLEAVSDESREHLAPWRQARIQRQAEAMARDPSALAAVVAALDKVDPRAGNSIDPIPEGLKRHAPPPAAWLTSGGNASRSAVPAALGAEFQLAWFKGPDADADLADSMDPGPQRHDRPSLWLPPRAVATDAHLFVSDGMYLHIYDLETGARVFADRAETRFPGVRAGGHETDTSEDRRRRYGLLEGHSLTLAPVRDFRGRNAAGRQVTRAGRGWLVLAAVPDGNEWPVRRVTREGQRARDDHIQAFHWDGLRLTPLWRAGGLLRSRRSRGRAARALVGLPYDTRLYGAPLVYRGRVWVPGVRRAKATKDRFESWLYSLDPATGAVLSRTHLGTGTPMRAGRMDEVIPASPAAAHGRVVVATSLGFLAAVDASDGRVAWIYRYDRDVDTERSRRNRDRPDEGLRQTSFCNEAPVLTLDRCLVTPTDSNLLLRLFNRPRTAGRSMDSRPIDRMIAAQDFMVEHIAGVIPGDGQHSPQLILVGKGERGNPPGPLVVARGALDNGVLWPQDAEREALWREESPTGFGADPYGRALVTSEEIFVPTAHGIVIYEVRDRDANGTHYLGILDSKDIPEALRSEAPERPYGNLIPIPGRGLVAVSATSIAFWKKKAPK